MDIIDYLVMEIVECCKKENIQHVGVYTQQNSDKQNTTDIFLYSGDVKVTYTILPPKEALSVVASELVTDFKRTVAKEKQKELL